MTAVQHFLKWLCRKDKSFTENLQFALKAWKSSEFALSSKYDVILNWVAEEGSNLNEKEFPTKEYIEILQLRANPALISSESKRKFVETILKHAETSLISRTFPEILYKLLALEWMQDLLRSDYTLTSRLYGKLFQLYEAYLKENSDSNKVKLTSNEANFFSSILNLLKEQLKNSGSVKDWMGDYDSHIVKPLTQVLLILRVKYEINFFDEMRDLEGILRESSSSIVQKLLKLPMHSAMLTLECAIVNRRMDKGFLREVLRAIFSDIEHNDTTSIDLLKAAYILNILRKHNVLFNFEIDSKTSIDYLGTRIYAYASTHRDVHLCEVLLLLCTALRLNPLILEKHVFELTTWMIVAPKSLDDNGQTLALFEEYLALFLDMFRRLSRAEKLVVNLLKSLKEWLDKNQLPPLTSSPKKLLKRKLKYSEAMTNKKTKLNNGNAAFIQFSNNYYIEMLFDDFRMQFQSVKQALTPNNLQSSFVYLYCAWPSPTIGYSFSCLITGLVIKASITIWKTLLYSLKEQLDILNNEKTDSENAHFRLDIHASLLCQYFAGARPTEQYVKYINEIAQLRKFTKEVLSVFGQMVIERSYHKRTVNAFLECCYYASNFELFLAYYKPDGLEDDSLVASNIIPNLHAFLKPEQWLALEQRILSYGKNDCPTLFERIQLQRLEAQKLLKHPIKETIFSCDNEIEKFARLLNASTNGTWIISQLNRTEKVKLINYKMQDISTLGAHNFLKYINEHGEALELLSYAIFEYLCKNFTATCKSSLLAALNCNFESIRQCSTLEHNDFDKTLKATANVIVQYSLNYNVKKLPTESIKHVLELLPCLPFGHLRRQTKSLLFVFYVAFYQDLRMAGADVEAKQLFACLTDLLHFGQQIPIFRYFEMTRILQLLPISDCWELYKILFSTIKNEAKGTDEFLKSLKQLLSNSLSTTGSLDSDECRLLVIAIETLSALSGQIGRRVHKHLHSLLLIYEDYVFKHFENETSSKKEKKFVGKTLPGFAPFTKAVIGATASNNTTDKNKNDGNEDKTKEHSQISLKPLDENFRKICKIYIGHSMDYRNPHAITLTQVALKNRKLLHLDLDEIELVLNTYWRQLNADLRETPEIQIGNSSEKNEISTAIVIPKTAETLVKMIIENKTNEDFLFTLKEIGSNIDERSYTNIIDLLSLIAKSSFSTIKGAIFNEQFKQITGGILLQLSKDEKMKFKTEAPVIKLLSCQQAFVENRSIPLTPDTLDTILGLLININIKKYPITDTNAFGFYTLHAKMTSLCSSIIKQRHMLLMDRIPQFMHIFKDLLQAIVYYKSDRQKDTSLNPDELNELAELALKLEVLMHAIGTHRTDVKRVAPFVLIFAINLMVSGKRPTTLYPNIKTHIEAICYSLIGICDHRVGGFILRCSNEASRQVYELLVKDHEKYHKFKGKV